MKKITQLLFFTLFTCVTYAQEITLIDFGLPGEITAGNWNNITDPTDLISTIDLIDNTGALTGEGLTLADAFDDDLNGWGTQAPGSPASDWANSQATRDNFFGEDVDFSDGVGTVSNEPTGGFILSGLEAGKYYSFKIFASRIVSPDPVDNRETLYTITGDGGPQTATLDPVDNTSNVATILNVQPDVNEEIYVQVEKGLNNTNPNGFYYLGAIEMTKADTTLSNKGFEIKGTVSVYPNPSSDFVKISLNLKSAAKVKMNVYDITGKLVASLFNEEKSAGAFVQTWDRSSVASGLYILKIDADGRTHNSKLILK